MLFERWFDVGSNRAGLSCAAPADPQETPLKTVRCTSPSKTTEQPLSVTAPTRSAQLIDLSFLEKLATAQQSVLSCNRPARQTIDQKSGYHFEWCYYLRSCPVFLQDCPCSRHRYQIKHAGVGGGLYIGRLAEVGVLELGKRCSKLCRLNEDNPRISCDWSTRPQLSHEP